MNIVKRHKVVSYIKFFKGIIASRATRSADRSMKATFSPSHLGPVKPFHSSNKQTIIHHSSQVAPVSIAAINVVPGIIHIHAITNALLVCVIQKQLCVRLKRFLR